MIHKVHIERAASKWLVWQRQLNAEFDVNFRKKIIDWNLLAEWRGELRRLGKILVVTNGCFDLLHAGHVSYLESARNLGDALLVGLNGDAAVRELKGVGRPLNNEQDRSCVLAALESVDAVCIFQEATASHFLERAEPDIYVKGGDYTLATLNQEERRTVEAKRGRIEILPLLEGRSTTALLKRIGPK